MSIKKVMIVCGGGASSGFLAQKIRKAAKNRDIDLDIKARSESELEDYLEELDVVLFGPHLKYMEAELKEKAEPYNIPVSIIEHSIYGLIDGEKGLELILELLNNK